MSDDQNAVTPPADPPVGSGSVGTGVMIGFGSALFAPLIAALLAILPGEMALVALVPPFGIGLVQLLWIVPMVLKYRKTGRTETAKGVIIAASIIFMLNAACWGLLATGGFRFAG